MKVLQNLMFWRKRQEPEPSEPLPKSGPNATTPEIIEDTSPAAETRTADAERRWRERQE